MIEDGFAQAVATKVSLTGMRDAHEGGLVTNQGVGSGLNTYTPFDQARPATLSVSPEVARQVAIARQELTDRYLDAHQRSAPGVGSTEVLTINSGRDIEWPQIGVGFGIGLLLALGLGLTMRAVTPPVRPLVGHRRAEAPRPRERPRRPRASYRSTRRDGRLMSNAGMVASNRGFVSARPLAS
jgi:hypothetical protein